MTYNDVARKLGMILTPGQELYREYRRAGVQKDTARMLAYFNAGGRADTQAQAVQRFIQQHAVWTIPNEAFPS